MSERPGSPGTLLLSEPMSRMFIGLWGIGASTFASAAEMAARSLSVRAAVPVLPTTETRPLA